MKLNLKTTSSLLFFSILFLFSSSCSKDSDLLSEYVIEKPDNNVSIQNKTVNDFFTLESNTEIILDVLQNDNFENLSNVRIIGVSEPSSGTITINNDNTLTYVPIVESEEEQTEEPVIDTFTYTTEETTEENTIVTEEAEVTIDSNDAKKIKENVYFVTTNGSSDNDGHTEETAWSWKYAVSQAKPGNIIYVKAGNYGGGNYTFNKNGTEENKIKIIGYKDEIGDINAFNQNLLPAETRDRRGTTQYANNIAFNYEETPDYSQMPFFNKEYIRNDIFFTVTGNYIEFHNIIIKGGDIGILFNSSSNHCKLLNSIVMEQGRLDIELRDTSHPDRYRGIGVANRKANNLNVRFCSFLNCEQEAIEIRGANSGTYSDNVVFSYNKNNGTDYFYLLTSEGGVPSQGLTIEYNRCHRLNTVKHGGHGFITKNGAINNIIKNWTVINSSIETSFSNSNNNLFEKGQIQGSFSTSGDPLTYLLTSNGSTGNTFKDIIIDDVWGGIVFLDHGEDSSSAYAARANDYINIIVKNARYGVIFSESNSNLGGANDNKFLNCTFFNTKHGIRAYRTNSGNSFINCHFSASSLLFTNHQDFTLNKNTKFENCHFSGNLTRNSADTFQSANNIGGNPQFQNPDDAINSIFNVEGLQLSPNSPLIGAGQNTSIKNPKSNTDFSGKNRTLYNIGAF